MPSSIVHAALCHAALPCRAVQVSVTTACHSAPSIISINVFGAGFVGFVLDRTRAFKIIMGLSQTAVLGFAIALSTSFGNDSLPRLQACLVCMGVLGFLILPAALEMSAEVAYPYSAALSAGLLWMGANIGSVVLGVIVDYALVDESADKPRFSRGRWLLLACFVVACLLWWLFPVKCAAAVLPGTLRDARARLS